MENVVGRGGVTLVLVSDKTHEGTQFCCGFGGLGAILLWDITECYFGEVDDYGEEIDRVDISGENEKSAEGVKESDEYGDGF